MNQLIKTDAYKLHHINQYPQNTQTIYANLTVRNNKLFNKTYGENIYIVNYGVRYSITKLFQQWKHNFFNLKWENIKKEIIEFENRTNIKITQNLEVYKQLHDLGYLPLKFDYLEDYVLIKPNTPIMIFWNTLPQFYWLVNYVETYFLSEFWALLTSANISNKLYELALNFSEKTCENNNYIPYQFHDFSYRGINTSQGAIKTGLGHLAFFKGSDNLPSISEKIKFYKSSDKIVATSIPATEHSVMSSYPKENELKCWQKLLNLYPNENISIVADTYDYFNFINNILPLLKEDILNREGKTIIRGDSGNPKEIIEFTINKLGKIFGFTTNNKGYKELNPKIGIIYGDGINYEYAKEILESLESQKWASNNIVFGVGSYTYQYITRDLFSLAIKTTAIKINKRWKNIKKEVPTDPNKKSLSGFLKWNYYYHNNKIIVGAIDDQKWINNFKSSKINNSFRSGKKNETNND